MEDISTQSFEEALKNIKVVYGAVKAAGVWKTSSDYEDYVQDGVILFAKIIDLYQESILDPEDIYHLAFKKIMWMVLDKLRRQKLANDYFVGLEGIEEVIGDDSSEPWLRQVVEDIVPQLSVMEVVILQKHLLNGYQITELVSETGLSYRTLSRAKASLLKKLRKVFTDI